MMEDRKNVSQDNLDLDYAEQLLIVARSSDTEITTDNGYVITTKEHYERLRKYRLCRVRGRKAIFHRWTEIATVVEPSLLVGGSPGRQTNITLAIVEYKNGKVEQVYPGEIISFKEGKHAKRETAEQKEI